MKKRTLLYIVPAILILFQAGCSAKPVNFSESPAESTTATASNIETTEAATAEPATLTSDPDDQWYQTWNVPPFNTKSISQLDPQPDEMYSFLDYYNYESDSILDSGEIVQSIHYIIPQFNNKIAAAEECNTIINNYIMKSLKFADEHDMDSLKDDEYLETIKDRSHINTSEFSLDYQVTYADDNMVNVMLEGYDYMGGAHGTPWKTSFLFDIKNGNRLSLSDIFGTETSPIIEKRNQAVSDLIRQEPDRFFDTALDYIEQNKETDYVFYVTEEGIVFYYSPYEIAPYSSGFIDVTIPFDQLPELAYTP